MSVFLGICENEGGGLPPKKHICCRLEEEGENKDLSQQDSSLQSERFCSVTSADFMLAFTRIHLLPREV